jgi:hypothetical protein
LDRVQQVAPTARGPRLLMRLGLFAFCAGLLLLLSSRPADAAERREPQLLDPVGTTLKATAREVDSFAGRATGSGSSTVARTVDAARQAVAPPPRPTPGAARSPVAATVKRGAPAVTSPVRRVAPPTRQLTPPTRPAARVAKAAAAPVERVAGVAGGPVERVARVAGGPAERVAAVRWCGPVDDRGNLAPRCATLPHRGSEHGAGSLEGARFLAPVVGLIGPILRPLGPALAPVGSALAPITGPVGGLAGPVVPGGLLPLPGLSVPEPGRGPAPPPGPRPFRSQVSRAPGRPQASYPRPRRIRSVWPPTAPARPPPGHPVLAGPDRRGEPAWLPGVGRAPRGRAGPPVDLLGRRLRPGRPRHRPAPPRPPRPRTRPARPAGPHLALLPPARLSRLATRAT